MLSKWVNGHGADYHNAVWRAVTDTRAQSGFRRQQAYIDVLEVADYHGRRYLEQIEDPVIIRLLHESQAADQVGNPHTYNFLGRRLSPNTIRYAKVLQDLTRLFPRFASFERVVEIGVGYGGQARILSEYAKATSTQLQAYDLIDILPVCFLAQTYLDNFHMRPSCRYMTKSQVPRTDSWDLVISNYAFSEFDADLEREYLELVLSKAKCGYLTMNSGLSNAGQWGSQSYIPVEQLLAELPNAVLLSEYPVVYPSNYIIVFGDHCAGRGKSLDELREIERAQVAEFQSALNKQREQQVAALSPTPVRTAASPQDAPKPKPVAKIWSALSRRLP